MNLNSSTVFQSDEGEKKGMPGNLLSNYKHMLSRKLQPTYMRNFFTSKRSKFL